MIKKIAQNSFVCRTWLNILRRWDMLGGILWISWQDSFIGSIFGRLFKILSKISDSCFSHCIAAKAELPDFIEESFFIVASKRIIDRLKQRLNEIVRARPVKNRTAGWFRIWHEKGQRFIIYFLLYAGCTSLVISILSGRLQIFTIVFSCTSFTLAGILIFFRIDWNRQVENSFFLRLIKEHVFGSKDR